MKQLARGFQIQRKLRPWQDLAYTVPRTSIVFEKCVFIISLNVWCIQLTLWPVLCGKPVVGKRTLTCVTTTKYVTVYWIRRFMCVKYAHRLHYITLVVWSREGSIYISDILHNTASINPWVDLMSAYCLMILLISECICLNMFYLIFVVNFMVLRVLLNTGNPHKTKTLIYTQTDIIYTIKNNQVNSSACNHIPSSSRYKHWMAQNWITLRNSNT